MHEPKVVRPMTFNADAPIADAASSRALPTPVWGRDELDAGEMWNSNSVTSRRRSTHGLNYGAGIGGGCRISLGVRASSS
jgi:hypothetical protein